MKLFEVTNTTWENLQIAKHKSVQCAEWMTLICALRFADFSQVVFSPRTTSRTISFSISNSFLVLIWVISEWLSLKIRASDRGDNAREVRSSRIVGGASVGPQRDYQHFLGGNGQENVQKMFRFSDMLFTKHWKQIPKKQFSKTRKLRPKIFVPNFAENDWA